MTLMAPLVAECTAGTARCKKGRLPMQGVASTAAVRRPSRARPHRDPG
jgi:hypothetical protein